MTAERHLSVSVSVLSAIHAHGEAAYPEEGAGFLLGRLEGACKQVTEILPLANAREAQARSRRYLITPHDYLLVEHEAGRRGLEVLGVFHSHPDHPNQPSAFDQEWAWPWFSYLITSIYAGQAASHSASRSWLLAGDRSKFIEEKILVREV